MKQTKTSSSEKPKKKPRWSLRFQFSITTVSLFLIITLIAWFILWLLNRLLQIRLVMPDILWLTLFVLVLGIAGSLLLTHIFFEPISRLGRAMGQVATGNFKVWLEPAGHFREIRKIYSDFNLMTRDLSNTEILQSDFISNVSHEFKTPINAIEGYAALLQDRSLTPEEQGQYVDKILYNTNRLSTLVGNILLLSRINNQAIHLKPQLYRLDEQIRQAILALETKWTAKSIDFDVDLAETQYEGYEGLMFHVFTNLIDNAVKFDPPGGYIRLRLRPVQGQAVFTIEDNGPGIRPEDMERIFDKFYQSDNSHQEDGNGLGLALVKRIVTENGGSITVENRPEGGSCFRVSLPLPAEDGAT